MKVPFFPFLTLMLIFIVASTAYRAMLDKKRKDREDAFWSREEQAEHTPPVDLSTLTYITMPADGFHLAAEGEEAETIEEELMELSQKPILNLSGMTNTDVKITYGTSNFEKMQEIGENYDRLVILLVDYAKLLYQQKKINETVEVLEFGVEVGTDISANYTLLGDCYAQLGEWEKLRELITRVENMNLLLGAKILESLNGHLTDTENPDGEAGSGTGDARENFITSEPGGAAENDQSAGGSAEANAAGNAKDVNAAGAAKDGTSTGGSDGKRIDAAGNAKDANATGAAEDAIVAGAAKGGTNTGGSAGQSVDGAAEAKEANGTENARDTNSD